MCVAPDFIIKFTCVMNTPTISSIHNGSSYGYSFFFCFYTVFSYNKSNDILVNYSAMNDRASCFIATAYFPERIPGSRGRGLHKRCRFGRFPPYPVCLSSQAERYSLIPSLLMFTAAFTSLSSSAPQSGHLHLRTDRSFISG